MTAKHGRTLFEAMQESRGETPPSGSVPTGGTPQPPAAPLSDRLFSSAGPRYEIQLTLRQTLVALAVIVLIVLVAMYVGFLIGARQKAAKAPTVSQARHGQIDLKLLQQSGPKALERDRLRYDPHVRVGDVPPRAQPPATASAAGSAAAADPAQSSLWRVRILSTAQSHKADLDKARAFLTARGIETVHEVRSGFYVLYTQQTFPTDRHEALLQLVGRLRELGKEFSRASGTNTDFADAMPVKGRTIGGG